jgi:hypothetical protein
MRVAPETLALRITDFITGLDVSFFLDRISSMTMEEITGEVKVVRHEKIIIDTNVLVSALIQRGFPYLYKN